MILSPQLLVHRTPYSPMDDAVTIWLNQLKAGNAGAARPLWDKYFHRLVGLAKSRLRSCSRRAVDEEDLALSAFESFCRNAEAGRFPDLSDRDSLWRLLAAFTLRKVAHHVRDSGRQKRNGETIHAASTAPLEGIMGREPDPALVAEVTEECERLLSVLGEPILRRVAILRVEGHTVEEIAAAIGCATRSVKRKLQLVRSIWEREAEHGPR